MASVPKTPTTKRIRNLLGTRSLTPDTPSRKLHIHTNDADLSLSSIREANKADLGPDICRVPLDIFCEKYLPSVRPEYRDLELIEAKLRASGDLTDKGWKDFTQAPRGRKHVHEDICYATVKVVANAIVTAAKTLYDANPSLHIICNPTKKPGAERRASNCRPDCCIVRSKGEPQWEDIAVSCEDKKDDVNVDKTNLVRRYSLLSNRDHIANIQTHRIPSS